MKKSILIIFSFILIVAPSVYAAEFGLFGQAQPSPTSPPSYSESGYGGGNYSQGAYDGGSYTQGAYSGGVSSDINGSGKVDIFDLSILLSNWDKAGKGDLNSSGKVDIFDLSILLSSWTK